MVTGNHTCPLRKYITRGKPRYPMNVQEGSPDKMKRTPKDPHNGYTRNSTKHPQHINVVQQTTYRKSNQTQNQVPQKQQYPRTTRNRNNACPPSCRKNKWTPTNHQRVSHTCRRKNTKQQRKICDKTYFTRQLLKTPNTHDTTCCTIILRLVRCDYFCRQDYFFFRGRNSVHKRLACPPSPHMYKISETHVNIIIRKTKITILYRAQHQQTKKFIINPPIFLISSPCAAFAETKGV